MTIQVPVDVALSAFDVLVGCAGLYEHVRRDSKVGSGVQLWLAHFGAF